MKYFFDIISERRQSSLFVKGVLTALSYLFRVGVRLRHFFYDKKWLKSARLSAPVISVGNIVVGGTGKTPFVQMLTCALQHLGKVAILSRGFKSKMERAGASTKISANGIPLCAVDQCGDEPFYLGQQTLADIWVGRDRIVCGQKAIQEGAECLILDDGMQHRRLARDVEIVVIDGKDPLGKGKFLPRGMLRDSPLRLQEADLIIANHVSDEAHLTALRTSMRKYTEAPILAVHVELLEIDSIQHKRVGVYCGIGRPERFLECLGAINVEIVDQLFLMDHDRPTHAELHQFAQTCQKKGAECIICTLKDWVKLPANFSCSLPIKPVKMQLAIFSGRQHWDALIQNIADHIAKNRSQT